MMMITGKWCWDDDSKTDRYDARNPILIDNDEDIIKKYIQDEEYIQQY
jgi:hypothetical protein